MSDNIKSIAALSNDEFVKVITRMFNDVAATNGAYTLYVKFLVEGFPVFGHLFYNGPDKSFAKILDYIETEEYGAPKEPLKSGDYGFMEQLRDTLIIIHKYYGKVEIYCSLAVM